MLVNRQWYSLFRSCPRCWTRLVLAFDPRVRNRHQSVDSPVAYTPQAMKRFLSFAGPVLCLDITFVVAAQEDGEDDQYAQFMRDHAHRLERFTIKLELCHERAPTTTLLFRKQPPFFNFLSIVHTGSKASLITSPFAILGELSIQHDVVLTPILGSCLPIRRLHISGRLSLAGPPSVSYASLTFAVLEELVVGSTHAGVLILLFIPVIRSICVHSLIHSENWSHYERIRELPMLRHLKIGSAGHSVACLQATGLDVLEMQLQDGQLTNVLRHAFTRGAYSFRCDQLHLYLSDLPNWSIMEEHASSLECTSHVFFYVSAATHLSINLFLSSASSTRLVFPRISIGIPFEHTFTSPSIDFVDYRAFTVHEP
jgi:hypothetical protein